MTYINQELDRTKSLEDMIKEIERSPVMAQRNEGRDFTSIHVSLPYNPKFCGEVEVTENGDEDVVDGVFLLTLEVNPEFRRQGIATRLVRSMVYVAKAEGYERLYSSVDSPHSIRIIRSLSEEADVTFYDDDVVVGRRVEIPMSLDQAIMSLERMNEINSREEGATLSFPFAVDLGNVALSSLEEPSLTRNQYY